MSPAVMSINGPELKQASEANETAKSIRKYLNERIRNTAITDLPRTKMEILRSGGTVEEGDYVEYWKKLDAIGVGTFFKGRGINKDTFTWKYSLKIVAQAMSTGSVEELPKHVQKVKPKLDMKAIKTGKFVTLSKPFSRALHSAPKAAKRDKVALTVRTVHIHLRPDFMIELSVPQDFSKEEAQQLCRSVARLAG